MKRPPLILLLAMVFAASRCWGVDHADIRFLSLEQGRLTIVDDSDDPYFSRLQPQEMGAKTSAGMPNADINWQRSACRKRYQDAVRTFTPDEQSAIKAVIDGLYPLLHQKYPLFAAEPWRLIKVEHRLEGDVASSRGHCIVLTEGLMHAFISHAKSDGDAMDAELLLREQSHVMQRYHRPLFNALYSDIWGFVHMPKTPLLPFEFLDHQYLSPDAIEREWAYPVTVGPTTMLLQPQIFLRSTSSLPKLPQDLDVVVMTVENHDGDYRYVMAANGHAQIYELSTVRPYFAAFAPVTHLVHPNDIEAELFAMLASAESLSKPIDAPTPCMSRFAAWAASEHGFAPTSNQQK